MKEHPILFSAPMVRAILGGRKTQTQRVCKHQNLHIIHGMPWREKAIDRIVDGVPTKIDKAPNGEPFVEMFFCPYGKIGDRLWVRETWAKICYSEDGQCNGKECLECSFDYRADKPYAKWAGDWDNGFGGDEVPDGCKWRPSIFMPRAASRIALEITDIRCERLSDISEGDAIAEGIEPIIGQDGKTYYGNYGKEDIGHLLPPVESYRSLWESINGPESWADNPYVWVISFIQL